MSLTKDSQRDDGATFYRREFRQEQFLYEETSNIGTLNDGENCFTEPYHYIIFTLIGLLFIGCICILTLDLLLPRKPAKENRAGKKRRVEPRRQSSPNSNPRPGDECRMPQPNYRVESPVETDNYRNFVNSQRNNTPVIPKSRHRFTTLVNSL